MRTKKPLQKRVTACIKNLNTMNGHMKELATVYDFVDEKNKEALRKEIRAYRAVLKTIPTKMTVSRVLTLRDVLNGPPGCSRQPSTQERGRTR